MNSFENWLSSYFGKNAQSDTQAPQPMMKHGGLSGSDKQDLFDAFSSVNWGNTLKNGGINAVTNSGNSGWAGQQVKGFIGRLLSSYLGLGANG